MKKLFLICLFVCLFAGCTTYKETELEKMLKVINTACDDYCFPYQWALAIFWSEHSGIKNINQKCSYGRTAYGVGGLLYMTAKQDLGFTGKESELNDYNVSIPLCVKFMAKLNKAYKGDMKKVVNHYISGNPNNERHKHYYDKIIQIIYDMGSVEL